MCVIVAVLEFIRGNVRYWVFVSLAPYRDNESREFLKHSNRSVY